MSVIVCAYTLDRWDLLVRALQGIIAQDVPGQMSVMSATVQILVVVDHNEELLARLKEIALPVEVVANDRTRGLSGARNQGLAAASGDVLVFLDDDAVPDDGWLAAHLAAYATTDATCADPATGSDRRVVGTAGHVEPAWAAPPPAWWPEEFLWVVGCSYAAPPEPGTVIRNPIGANMAFRRDVLVALGGFNEGLGRVGTRPLGCEETEVGIRAAAITGGGVVVAAPAAVCHHLVPSDRATWSYFWRRCWSEGRSKAHVARLVGGVAATATERTYVTDVLRRALWRALRRMELRRAGAIMAGVAVTAAGYGAETLRPTA